MLFGCSKSLPNSIKSKENKGYGISQLNRNRNIEVRDLKLDFNLGQGHDKGKGQGQCSKMKGTEKQIFVTLLLVTFSFLILNCDFRRLFIKRQAQSIEVLGDNTYLICLYKIDSWGL